MENFISPDGKSVRFIISHEGDPATVEGISQIVPIKTAAKEAIKALRSKGPPSTWRAPAPPTKT